MVKAEATRYGVFSPDNDKYLTSRVLAKFARFFGEKGELALGIYTYLRWVDNSVDLSPAAHKLEKDLFLQRQINLLNAGTPENPHPIESMFVDLPWETVGKDNTGLLKKKVSTILQTIQDDNEHKGSIPRTYSELKEYNINTFLSCIQILNIILNGKDLIASGNFMELVNNGMNIISLRDFLEDLEYEMLQVGFNEDEAKIISSLPTSAERRMEALHVYDKYRFQKEKGRNLRGSSERLYDFLELDIPWWQKALSIIYMLRAQVKAYLTVNYPDQNQVGAIKRQGLTAKTKRLIREYP